MSSVLAEPFRIGRMELKNRMVMAPMGVTVGNMDASTVDYFVAVSYTHLTLPTILEV